MKYSKSVNIKLYRQFYNYSDPRKIPFDKIALHLGVEPNKLRGMIRPATQTESIFLQLVEEGDDPSSIPAWFARPKTFKAKRRRAPRRTWATAVVAGAPAGPVEQKAQEPQPARIILVPVKEPEPVWTQEQTEGYLTHRREIMAARYRPKPVTPEALIAQMQIKSYIWEQQNKLQLGFLWAYMYSQNIKKLREAEAAERHKREIAECVQASNDFFKRLKMERDDIVEKRRNDRIELIKGIVKVFKEPEAPQEQPQDPDFEFDDPWDDDEEKKEETLEEVADRIAKTRRENRRRKALSLHVKYPLLFPWPEG